MNNMKIQFNTVPQSPMIDTKTQLRFAVQNLTDSKNISDLHARVVLVTNSYGQVVTLKFENFSSNGVFSMNYVFPDSRTYQVIARVDSNNLSTLGSFKVNVPFQPVGSVTTPTTSPFSVIIIAGIVSATVAVSLVPHSKA